MYINFGDLQFSLPCFSSFWKVRSPQTHTQSKELMSPKARKRSSDSERGSQPRTSNIQNIRKNIFLKFWKNMFFLDFPRWDPAKHQPSAIGPKDNLCYSSPYLLSKICLFKTKEKNRSFFFAKKLLKIKQKLAKSVDVDVKCWKNSNIDEVGFFATNRTDLAQQ